MKYPKKSHYLRFRKKDRYTSYVLDYRGGSLYEMDICCARFLRSLNGCRDPYKNTKGLTEEEAETALEHFEKLGFLDDGIRPDAGTAFCSCSGCLFWRSACRSFYRETFPLWIWDGDPSRVR